MKVIEKKEHPVRQLIALIWHAGNKYQWESMNTNDRKVVCWIVKDDILWHSYGFPMANPSAKIGWAFSPKRIEWQQRHIIIEFQ